MSNIREAINSPQAARSAEQGGFSLFRRLESPQLSALIQRLGTIAGLNLYEMRQNRQPALHYVGAFEICAQRFLRGISLRPILRRIVAEYPEVEHAVELSFGAVHMRATQQRVFVELIPTKATQAEQLALRQELLHSVETAPEEPLTGQISWRKYWNMASTIGEATGGLSEDQFAEIRKQIAAAWQGPLDIEGGIMQCTFPPPRGGPNK